MDSLETVQHFIDDYLGYLHELRPTPRRSTACTPSTTTRRLHPDRARSTGTGPRRFARVCEHPTRRSEPRRSPRPRVARTGCPGPLLELERVRPHERSRSSTPIRCRRRSPASVLNYAPAPERGRRLVSKLRQVPPFLTRRARTSRIRRVFIRRRSSAARAVAFIERDMPRALWALDAVFVRPTSTPRRPRRSAHHAYVTELETDALPKAKGSFRLGPSCSPTSCVSTRDRRPARELIAIAERELAETQDAFRRTASKVRDGDPAETWQALKADHPAAGKVVAEAREQVQALRAFVEREGFVSVPEHDPIQIAPTPPFCRWTFASIWCPGPFEGRGVRAHYYLTDVEANWSAERQEQHLPISTDRRSAHLDARGLPGHYLHFQHLRQIARSCARA